MGYTTVKEENRAKKRRLYLRKLKDGPCMDCGGRFPYYVMHFDHREGEVKVAGISELVRRRDWQTIQTEVQKCDLVCSNCHHIRTWQRSVGS